MSSTLAQRRKPHSPRAKRTSEDVPAERDSGISSNGNGSGSGSGSGSAAGSGGSVGQDSSSNSPTGSLTGSDDKLTAEGLEQLPSASIFPASQLQHYAQEIQEQEDSSSGSSDSADLLTMTTRKRPQRAKRTAPVSKSQATQTSDVTSISSNESSDCDLTNFNVTLNVSLSPDEAQERFSHWLKKPAGTASQPGPQPAAPQSSRAQSGRVQYNGPPEGQPTAAAVGAASSSSSAGAAPAVPETRPHRLRHCACCNRTETPMWRNAGDGTPLCNACGIRYRKNLVKCPSCYYIPRKSQRNQAKCPRCHHALVHATPLSTRSQPSQPSDAASMHSSASRDSASLADSLKPQ
eukprot:m.76646 g.76646  ORF g.76646 m.76646 type:complete len:349 (-) comp17241_c0_seq1:141-1187(-)